MRYAVVGVLLVCCGSPLPAAEADDALRQLVAKSACIARGEGIAVSVVDRGKDGQVTYEVKFAKLEFLKDVPAELDLFDPSFKNRPLAFRITRQEPSDDDRLPYLKDGGKVVLFLKYKPSRDVKGKVHPEGLADIWLGVQPDSASLAKRVRELTQDE
jgi:hypothetical protein